MSAQWTIAGPFLEDNAIEVKGCACTVFFSDGEETNSIQSIAGSKP